MQYTHKQHTGTPEYADVTRRAVVNVVYNLQKSLQALEFTTWTSATFLKSPTAFNMQSIFNAVPETPPAAASDKASTRCGGENRVLPRCVRHSHILRGSTPKIKNHPVRLPRPKRSQSIGEMQARRARTQRPAQTGVLALFRHGGKSGSQFDLPYQLTCHTLWHEKGTLQYSRVGYSTVQYEDAHDVSPAVRISGSIIVVGYEFQLITCIRIPSL